MHASARPAWLGFGVWGFAWFEFSSKISSKSNFHTPEPRPSPSGSAAPNRRSLIAAASALGLGLAFSVAAAQMRQQGEPSPGADVAAGERCTGKRQPRPLRYVPLVLKHDWGAHRAVAH